MSVNESDADHYFFHSSDYVLHTNWGISNSYEVSWYLAVLKQAIARYGAPQIVNSDQPDPKLNLT